MTATVVTTSAAKSKKKDLIYLFLARFLLLAGNCLPYHQPEFLQIKISGKHWGFLALFVWHLDSTYSVENSLGYQRSGFSGWNFLRLLSKVFPGSRESSLAHWIRDLWVIFYWHLDSTYLC